MVKRKGKNISFDAMVKFFMQNYNIPTKKDVDKLMARLDQLEKLIKSTGKRGRRGRPSAPKPGEDSQGRPGGAPTAVEQVLEVIRGFKQGAGVAEIKAKTGFDDKKIRNILFRLNKSGAIERPSRGTYVAK